VSPNEVNVNDSGEPFFLYCLQPSKQALLVCHMPEIAFSPLPATGMTPLGALNFSPEAFPLGSDDIRCDELDLDFEFG
jgi:hypothetical protein